MSLDSITKTNRPIDGTAQQSRVAAPVATPSADEQLYPLAKDSHLSLRFSERKLVLGFMDVFLLNVALYITLSLRMGSDSVQPFELIWFVVLSAIWLECAYQLDCYNLARAANALHSLGRLSAAVVVTSLIYMLLPYVTPALPTSRIEIFVLPALSLLFIAAWRAIYVLVFSQPNFHQRALVVGAGKAGATLIRTIAETDQIEAGGASLGYRIVGFVDDDPAKEGTRVEGVPVLGTRGDLVQLATQWRPHEIVVAITHVDQMNGELFEAILECREMGISITTMAAFYERLTGRVPIEHVGRALYVAMPLSQRSTHRFYLAFQRVFDIAISLIGCLFLLLVLPFVWLTNLLTSPGPLFFMQERVGKGRRPFYVVKFRSMIVDAEKLTGAVWASEHDPRITRAGRLLRKTRLDELPQFWNILKGDMSLIGPRPERPFFVAQLVKDIPLYKVRHAVKPGLTGWAQVRYRYGASADDSLVKLQYDLYYIKHQRILLDLEILFKTVAVVLGFKGR